MIFAFPIYAISFVLGVWQLQQTSSLLHWPMLAYLSAMVAVMFYVSRLAYVSHVSFKSLRPHASVLGLCASLVLCLGCFLAGFVWATAAAQIRMQHVLPKALEQIPVEIEAVVASSPQSTHLGARIKFDVINVVAPSNAAIAFENGQFPQQLSLNYYTNQYNFNTSLAVSQIANPVTRMQQPRSGNLRHVVHFEVGEKWRFTANLKRPHSTINPHGYDFEAWALSERLGATGTIKTKQDLKKLSHFVWRPKYMIAYVRVRIQAYVADVLAQQQHSGLLQALVMGDHSQISPDDWEVMLKTGTSHLMSISGLHISMFAGLMYALTQFCWRRVPYLLLRLPARKAATLIGLLAALMYALVAGFAVPTQRAFYMLCVFAIALWSNRQFAISQVLAVAMVVVVLIDPWAVVANGFWLSFGAVACLAFVMAHRVGKRAWIFRFMNAQWAITLGLLPVLLILFNQASIVSPLANALAIPLVSIVIAPLALAGGFLHIDFLLQVSHVFIQFVMQCLYWLSAHKVAVWSQHAPPSWTLFPAMLGVMLLLLPKGFPLKWLGLFGLLPMFLILPTRPEIGAMKVTVLDVSQGLSVVVQTKRHALLYDAGNVYNAYSDAGKNIIVPYLKAQGLYTLNGAMLSHDDADHTGGLKSILAMTPVAWLSASFDMNDYVKDLSQRPTLYRCEAGQHWTWDGVLFEVLYPSYKMYAEVASNDTKRSDNDLSCVLKITSRYGSILLTGDIEKQAERSLLNQAGTANKLASDVMVVPHHGSKTSSQSSFIDAVMPSAVIFTVGYLNRYHHPRDDIVDRYQQRNIALYRSDYHGGLELNFDANPHIGLVSARQQQKRYWHQTFGEN